MNADNFNAVDAGYKQRQNLRHRAWNLRRAWKLVDKRECQPGVWICLYYNGFGDFKVSTRIVDDLTFKPRIEHHARETAINYDGSTLENAIQTYMTA